MWTACGSANPQPVYGGNVNDAPSLVALPSSDVPKDELTPTMRFALDLSAEALQSRRPSPTESLSTADFQLWSDKNLVPWLNQKSTALEAARKELDKAAEENPSQRIMAGAVMGLIFEDVSTALLSVPTPKEFERDQEAKTLYLDVVFAQASPYLKLALRAYYACAANADIGPESMKHWRPFCAGRSERLSSLKAAFESPTSAQ